MPIVKKHKKWGPEYTQPTAPTFLKDGLTWYDTTSNELKVWHAESSTWRWAATGSGARFGYACGGNLNYLQTYSGIQRIDFPFDSAVLLQVANIETTRNSLCSGCNSSQFGFIMNGQIDTPFDSISFIRRFEFPFDSGLAQIIGNTTINKTLSSSCNSSQHGFSINGKVGVSTDTFFSSIERITFPFSSGSASVVGNILGSRSHSSACNSSLYGYSIGGYSSDVNIYSYVERILFPFNSGTSSHNSLMARTGFYNTSFNSSQHAYTCQLTSSSVSTISTIDRFLFPFNSGVATVVGNLKYSSTYGSGLNSTKTGYILGGFSGDTLAFVDVQEINFPFNSGIGTRRGVLSSKQLRPTAIDGVDFVTQLI